MNTQIKNLIRKSHPQNEGLFRASKWLKYQMLLDPQEMRSLFDHLGDFFIFVSNEPTTIEDCLISKEHFLQKYQSYIESIKSKEIVLEPSLRSFFSSGLTKKCDLLYAMEISEKKCLIKATKPFIQMQKHFFYVSAVDGKFYPMVHSDESISWGIQLSYPQLYQDPKTEEIVKVDQSENFPNTAFFSQIGKWLRNHTRPTPFKFQGKLTNVPIRIGKMCLPWINCHPELISKQIEVEV